MLNTGALFQEDFYLHLYPDVAQGIAEGNFDNGYQHFRRHGRAEGRDPGLFFNTSSYLQEYPDIATAFANNIITPVRHFINFGQFEGRDPFAEFDTRFYLEQNPDVAAAVAATAGTRDSLTGIEHFLEFGQFEGRDPGPGFNTDFYLQQNPDVAAAVNNGTVDSAIAHFLEFGKNEGRPGARAIDPGNNPNAAADLGLLSGTRSVGEFVGTSDPEDIYRFSLNAVSNFNLRLDGLSADADVTLLRDQNSNGTAEFNEFINFSVNEGSDPEEIDDILQAGDYFVQVSQFEGDTNYNLTLSAAPIANVPPDGAGSILSQARDIGVLNTPQTFSDFVGDADTDDLYRFTLNTTSQFSATLNGLSADADLFVVQDLNGDGVIVEETENLAASEQADSTPETININILDAGTYFVRVRQFDGNTNYNLSLSASPTTAPPPPGNPLPGFDPNFGFGLVNASAAVALAIGEPTPFADVPNAVVNNYGLDLLNVPEVWNRGFTGAGVLVAVLDTGMDLRHPDLDANLWRNADEIPNDGIDNDANGFIDDFRGYDFVDNDPDPLNEVDEEHGTHVAGTIAAARNGVNTRDLGGNPVEVTGVAYNATIMPVRVLGDFRTIAEFDAAVAAGIRYAVGNGARVLSMSLGNNPGDPPLPLTAAALGFARSQGVVAVIASGNEKDSGATVPDDPGIRAAEDLAIAVGAVDRDRRVADFSNPASNTLGVYDFVVAPGVDVFSTTPNNTYTSLSGTSMATPHVAGVVALMWQANPNLTPVQIEQILSQTVNRGVFV